MNENVIDIIPYIEERKKRKESGEKKNPPRIELEVREIIKNLTNIVLSANL